MSTLISQPTPVRIRVTFSLTAGAAAGTVFAGSMFLVEGQPSVTVVSVAGREYWFIDDMDSPEAALTQDIGLQIIIDNVAQPYSPQFNSIRQANLTRYTTPLRIPIPNNSSWGMNAINITAIPATAAVSVTMFINVIRYPLELVAMG